MQYSEYKKSATVDEAKEKDKEAELIRQEVIFSYI